MIGLPHGTRIWLAAGVTDMRRGFDGLATRVRQFAAKNGVFRKAPHVTMRVSGGFL